MTNQSTIDKLIEMTPMADAFRIQLKDQSMAEVPFEDRFGMLVDTEYTARKNNRLHRLIKKADFEHPEASIAALDYGHNRKINRNLIERLATCEYITEYRKRQEVASPILPARLGWRPVSITIPSDISGFLIFSWNCSQRGIAAGSRRYSRSIPILFC